VQPCRRAMNTAGISDRHKGAQASEVHSRCFRVR
jgi:hypothetical protein